VPHEDADFLSALAAFVHRKYRNRATLISGQMEGHEVAVGEDFVVLTVAAEGAQQSVPVTVTDFEGKTGSSSIQVGLKSYRIESSYRLGGIRISGHCNGEPFTAQVERGGQGGKNPLAIRVSHNGMQIEALVLSPRAAALYALMPYKAPPDMSRFVLSPMPGLLVDVAVQPGQKVQAGERVAVIEAMKMENVLFAAADGVVGKVLAAKGESLTVDQAIIEFA